MQAPSLSVQSAFTELRLPVWLGISKCAIIVERYRAYQQTQKQERLRLLRENVRQATFNVHAQGLYPSKARVAKQLGKSASMRNPDTRTFWKEAVQELGL